MIGDDQTQKDDGGQTDKAFQGQRKHGILQEEQKERIREIRAGAAHLTRRLCTECGWGRGGEGKGEEGHLPGVGIRHKGSLPRKRLAPTPAATPQPQAALSQWLPLEPLF